MLSEPKSLTQVANEQVPFATALAWADLQPPRDRGSRDQCPGCGSLDGFRGYRDHGYCQSCGRYFSVVGLLAAAWDMRRTDAAIAALDRIGYVPLSQAHRFDAARDRPPDISHADLAEALRTWCASALPGWTGYETRQAALLARCLGELGKVRTEEDCGVWLSRCKQVMSRAFAGMT
jgi:hypothetical protein